MRIRNAPFKQLDAHVFSHQLNEAIFAANRMRLRQPDRQFRRPSIYMMGRRMAMESVFAGAFFQHDYRWRDVLADVPVPAY